MDMKLDEKINRTAVDAARRKFSPEFMNRIDKIVVFRTLRAEHLQQILEIELGLVQQRILQATGNQQFVFSCTTNGEGVPAAGGNRSEVWGAAPETRHRDGTSCSRWPTWWPPARSSWATTSASTSMRRAR